MLPEGIERQVHQNRLLKLAREGGQMTAQHLRDLEATRRYATLVTIVLEAKATVIDEIVDLHDRIIGAVSTALSTGTSSNSSRYRALEHRLSGTGIQAIKARGEAVDEDLLQHLSPLGWEHINLTGDYVWRQDRRIQKGKFRPLRSFASA